ncbi:uncharacterized protein [Littorina saxatilis]
MTSRKSWFSARDTCNALSSSLVHVDSPYMVDFLVNIKDAGLLTNDEIWTASNDLLKLNDWRGAFGAKMTNIDWSPGLPDLSGDKNCATQKLTGDKSQRNKKCYGLLLPPTFQYVCELWHKDISAARFQQVTSSNLNSVLSGFGFVTDAALNDKVPVRRHYECAMRCLESRNICEGFVFNKSAQRCKFLRAFEPGLLGMLLPSTAITTIKNDGSKVYVMNG